MNSCVADATFAPFQPVALMPNRLCEPSPPTSRRPQPVSSAACATSALAGTPSAAAVRCACGQIERTKASGLLASIFASGSPAKVSAAAGISIGGAGNGAVAFMDTPLLLGANVRPPPATPGKAIVVAGDPDSGIAIG